MNRGWNNRNLIRAISSVIFTSLLLMRCASDQGQSQSSQQEFDGVSPSQGNGANASLNGGASTPPSQASQEGASMNNAVEGGAADNFTANNSMTGNPGANPAANLGANNSALGASLNNVPLENPASLATNAPLNTSTPLNQGATNLATTGLNTPAPLTNAAAPTNAAQPAPTNAATASAPPATTDLGAKAAASPFTNPHMNWPGKGKVKYATRQLTKHSSPNGPVVGEFEQGEHPLIYQNGNWAELNDGSFVKGNGLSEKGVGYKKGPSQAH